MTFADAAPPIFDIEVGGFCAAVFFFWMAALVILWRQVSRPSSTKGEPDTNSREGESSSGSQDGDQ